MKKKVLFALIALFSFVSVWAAVPGLTGLRDNVPENVYVIGDELPGASVGQISFMDANQKPVNSIEAVGWYFAKITNGGDVTIIKFQAWKPVNYEFINNEATFNASAAEGSGKALDLYYTEWIGKQEPNSPAEAAWIAERNSFQVAALGTADKTVHGVGFPFVVFTSTETVPCRVAFVTPNEAPYADNVPAEAGIKVIYPWASFHAGENDGNTSHTPIFFSTTDKTYGVASIPEEYLHGHGQIYWNEQQGVYVDEFSAINPAFDMSKLSVFFTPAKADAPVWYTCTVNPTSYVYNGYDQAETIITYIDVASIPAGEYNDTITTFYYDAECTLPAAHVKDAGDYYAEVKFVKNDEPVHTSVLKVTVTPCDLTVGAANVYKALGDPDPEPDYGKIYEQLKGDDKATDLNITGLVLSRLPVNGVVPPVEDDVMDGKYAYTILSNNASTGNPNYTLKVTSATAYIIVIPKAFNDDDFIVEITDDECIYDGQAQEPTVVVKRKIGEEIIVVPEGQYEVTYTNNINANVDPEGNKVNENQPSVTITAVDGGAYSGSMDANFDITQRNIEETDIEDIEDKVFKQGQYKPTPAVTFNTGKQNDDNEDIILDLVKDNGEDPRGDFTYSYAKNIYVTDAAECIIEAVFEGEGENKVYFGNYYGTKTKNFAITKREIVLKPKDGHKTFGEEDPAAFLLDETVLNLPSNRQLSQLLVETDGSLYTISRTPGEDVGVYPINVTGAQLLGPASSRMAPINNYTITYKPGVFEIVELADYYIASVNVEKTYDGQATVPYPTEGRGYKLFTQVEDVYQPVDDNADVYNHIIAPTANELVPDQGEGAGINVKDGGWKIRPVVPESDNYTLAYLPGDVEIEGYGKLTITPMNVTVTIEDKTSKFGQTPLPLTYTVDPENTPVVITLGVHVADNKTSDLHVLSATSPVGKYYIFGDPDPSVATNSNYNIIFERGIYEVTESDEKVIIAATGTKYYGEPDTDIEWEFTATRGTTEVDLTDYEGDFDVTRKENASQDAGTYENDGTISSQTVEKIDGYQIDFENSTVTTTILGCQDAIVLQPKTQNINYGASPVTGAVENDYIANTYVKVTGELKNGDTPATLGAVIGVKYFDENSDPIVGLVKNGTALTITVPEAVQTNYPNLICKDGKLNVKGDDEITLNRIAKADCVDEALSYADVVAPAKKNTVAQLIRDYDGVSADVNLADDFEFKANCWYPLVLPFDATVREISYAFGYAVIDIFQQSNAKTNDVLFILNVGEIKANEPFLIKVDQDIKMSEVEKFYLQNDDPEKARTIKYSANPTLVDAGGNQFVGTYSGKIFAADDYDCYYFPVATNSMAPTAEGKYVRPLGAYLKMTNRDHEAPVRIIIEEANGTMTVIEGVEAGAQAAEGEFAEGWYTITGVKLDAEPTTSGTYIFNGKKVFIQK